MPITHTNHSVNLLHSKGASVEVLLYGATIVSWKSASSKSKEGSAASERLFVSSKALLDGSKPVRGGIPVVFPIFGPPIKPEHSKLAQHGFARSEVWELEKTIMDNEAGVSVRFGLSLPSSVKEKYPYPCKLTYIVTLAEHQLTADLHVENTGTISMEFQALLHTYHRVPMSLATVTPLKGLSYTNKTKPGAPREIEQREAVDTRNFTDSVYENASGRYEIAWEGAGSLDVRSMGFKDVVLWNPGKDAGEKMSDMEENGWEHFICVEPGYVAGFVELTPGQTWKGQQVLTVL